MRLLPLRLYITILLDSVHISVFSGLRIEGFAEEWGQKPSEDFPSFIGQLDGENGVKRGRVRWLDRWVDDGKLGEAWGSISLDVMAGCEDYLSSGELVFHDEDSAPKLWNYVGYGSPYSRIIWQYN